MLIMNCGRTCQRNRMSLASLFALPALICVQTDEQAATHRSNIAVLSTLWHHSSTGLASFEHHNKISMHTQVFKSMSAAMQRMQDADWLEEILKGYQG